MDAAHSSNQPDEPGSSEAQEALGGVHEKRCSTAWSAGRGFTEWKILSLNDFLQGSSRSAAWLDWTKKRKTINPVMRAKVFFMMVSPFLFD